MARSKVSKNIRNDEKHADAVKKEGQTYSSYARYICMSVAIVAMAAIYSPISQLSLSPVFGSVPSAYFHRPGMMVTFICARLGKKHVRALLPANFTHFIPILAFAIPTIQYIIFQQSSRLGALYGPLLVEALTFYPLLLVSFSAAATQLGKLDLSDQGRFVANNGPFFWSYFLFNALEKKTSSWIPNYVGTMAFASRIGLQHLMAILYAILLPSKLLSLSVPFLIFTGFFNVHVPLNHTTALLNSSLGEQNYVLLHRQESLTGYLSVIENTKDRFRALRCDHSILGGEWTFIDNPSYPHIKEPIYPIFAMLEAIRLIKPDGGVTKKADANSNALIMYDIRMILCLVSS